MAEWSQGQQLAIEQLERVADADNECFSIGVPGKSKYGWLSVEVNMNFGDIPVDSEVIKANELVVLEIPIDFPYSRPQAWVRHKRFEKLPHILWGKYICLYLSENDWDPGDGMFGFLQRTADWFVRAAKGTLEEVGQPLHPPLARPSAVAGSIVIPIDFPQLESGAAWIGMALLSEITQKRAEVLEWLTDKTLQEHQESDFSYLRLLLQAAAWRRQRPTLLGPVVVLAEPLSFEFPENVNDLVKSLGQKGISRHKLVELLRVAVSVNASIYKADRPAPLYVFIGAPMRGIAGEVERRTHFAVWRLAPGELLALFLALLSDDSFVSANNESLSAFEKAMAEVPVSWTFVYEQRPEIVTRRDSGSPAEWLRGRSVLVLGCGALGARIAEHCVRAGVSRITIVDNGTVNPGILVRQPYTDADIGTVKAAALATRLSAINPNIVVNPVVGNILRTTLMQPNDAPDADIIIDATANRSVSCRIESLRWMSTKRWPPILTVGVGHECQRGIVSMAFPEATGAGADIFNNFALTAVRRPDLAADYYDFFPDSAKLKLFQPEPGCSDATFRGSDADAASLTAYMFSWGIRALRDQSLGRYVAPKSAFIIRLRDTLVQISAETELFEWENDFTVDDSGNQYQIRFCPAALNSIRSEALTTALLYGTQIETGGILLGRIDDACRVIWVTAAEGPTEDSECAQHYFKHGSAGVAEMIAAYRRRSGDRERFVGMWHTHPGMNPAPSPTDLLAMETLLVPGPSAPSRGILAVFGGRPRPWASWLQGVTEPNVYARLYRTAGRDSLAPYEMPAASSPVT